jgi:hypothetical protein
MLIREVRIPGAANLGTKENISPCHPQIVGRHACLRRDPIQHVCLLSYNPESLLFTRVQNSSKEHRLNASKSIERH